MAEPVQPGASITADNTAAENTSSSKPTIRRRASSVASAVSFRLRRAEKSFNESHIPHGFFAETAELASSTVAAAKEAAKESQAQAESAAAANPPIAEKKKAWKRAQKTKAKSDPKPTTTTSTSTNSQADAASDHQTSAGQAAVRTETESSNPKDAYASFPNGYHFPPKYNAKEGWVHFYKGTWNYITTPMGFFVVLYALNIVAWGGMLFLLLCNAAPAMCVPNCNDLESPRRTWLEIDMQILNALFCVTGFGLVPWRFRDLYFLLRYRIYKDEEAMRRLAGIHRNWIRLPGSDDLPIDIGPENIDERIGNPDVPEFSIPFPTKKTPPAPLTGIRAPATATWKPDYVIWMMVANTGWQIVLSSLMWGMNRAERPSWSTGFAVAMACGVSALGGLMMFFEGKRVKSIEGVPLTEEDKARLEQDRELGVYHYNNLKKKKPKEVAKQEKAAEKQARKTGVNPASAAPRSESNLLGGDGRTETNSSDPDKEAEQQREQQS